jgi:hypothetical protein
MFEFWIASSPPDKLSDSLNVRSEEVAGVVACHLTKATTEPKTTKRQMTFKKGDKIQTDDGRAGEILFVDKDGLSAQVALEHVSMKIRTESLRIFEADFALAPGIALDLPETRKARRKPIR